MHLVSVNAWGGRLYKKLIRYLSLSSADIICLQEVYKGISSNEVSVLDSTWSSDVLPVRLNLYQELVDVFDGYCCFFCPAYRKHFKLIDYNSISSIFGNMILVRNELEPLDYNEIYLYKQFMDVSPFNTDMPRKSQCVRLRPMRGSSALIIANIHGIWGGQFQGETNEIIIQGKKIVELINSISKPSDNIIICGDFNVMPRSFVFEAFQCLNVVNLMDSYNVESTRTSYYSGENKHTDHIFVSNRIIINTFEVLDTPEVSDHKVLDFWFEPF